MPRLKVRNLGLIAQTLLIVLRDAISTQVLLSRCTLFKIKPTFILEYIPVSCTYAKRHLKSIEYTLPINAAKATVSKNFNSHASVYKKMLHKEQMCPGGLAWNHPKST